MAPYGDHDALWEISLPAGCVAEGYKDSGEIVYVVFCMVHKNGSIFHIEGGSHNSASPSNLVEETVEGRQLKDLLKGVDGKDK
jgi:hypothetical protein